jgi:hypothetical protein
LAASAGTAKKVNERSNAVGEASDRWENLRTVGPLGELCKKERDGTVRNRGASLSAANRPFQPTRFLPGRNLNQFRLTVRFSAILFSDAVQVRRIVMFFHHVTGAIEPID